MPRPPKPFKHQDWYYTTAGGSWRKLVPISAGLAAAERELARVLAAGGGTVGEACTAYLEHAGGYYRHPDGRPTTGRKRFEQAFAYLDKDAPAAGQTAADLKAARNRMIAAGLSRRTCNEYVAAIRQAARWLAGEGVIPEAVAAGWWVVTPLPPFRSAAAETEPVEPVEWGAVRATVERVPEPWGSICRLMWWSGMRPGEACGLRRSELAAGGASADLSKRHKNAWRGEPRVVAFGPAARGVLAPWVEAAAAAGRDPLFLARSGRVACPRSMCSLLGEYQRRLGLPRWHANQIRHSFATRVRAALGLEAAQHALGHAKADTTEIYAERDQAVAARAAEMCG